MLRDFRHKNVTIIFMMAMLIASVLVVKNVFTQVLAKTEEQIQEKSQALPQERYESLEGELEKICYTNTFGTCYPETYPPVQERNLPKNLNLTNVADIKQLPAYHQAAIISMVKDEKDVIFENLCWHYYMGFRKFLIIDNGSTDETSAIIDRFKKLTSADTVVIKINDARVLYAQASRTNALIMLAEELFPEILWIFPNDADEFIVFGKSMEETLSEIPSKANCIYLPRITYIPTDDYFSHGKETPFYQRIHVAHKRNPYGAADDYMGNGKTFIRAHQGLRLCYGNHVVSAMSETAQIYASGVDYGIHIREFPLRSPEHALKKIVNMGKAHIELNKTHTNLKNEHYAQARYRRYLEVGEAAGLEEFKQFMTKGGFSFDERMPLERAVEVVMNPTHPFKNLSAVTYRFSTENTPFPGRFGDNIIAYMKAKFVSWKYSVPVLMKKFEYSDQLFLDQLETHIYKEIDRRNYDQIMYCKSAKELDGLMNDRASASTLYEIPFHDYFWDLDWNDPEFKKVIKEFVKPKKDFIFDLPKDRVTVALHVRTGGGCSWDTEELKKQMPAKFPPQSYYLECINKVIELYKGAPLYIHLFTDHPNPESIVAEYMKHLPADLDVQFNYRKTGNQHDAHVLEDFFHMTQYNVLVRPYSSFSMAAAIIGDHQVVIRPTKWIHATRKEGEEKIELAVDTKGGTINTDL